MKKIFQKIRQLVNYLLARHTIKGMGDRPTINHRSKFNGKTYLGKNTHFNGCRIKGNGEVHIGSNFHSGGDLLILTSFHNYSGNALPYDNTTIDKNIYIDDNVWVGERVIILGGVTIGEGAIVQAGSVVVSDVEPLSIAGGHPAKKFSSRDAEHYHEVKSQCLFH